MCAKHLGVLIDSLLLQPLEVLQKNILRTITSIILHVILRLSKNLNFLKLRDLYRFKLIKLTHKFHHEMLPT